MCVYMHFTIRTGCSAYNARNWQNKRKMECDRHIKIKFEQPIYTVCKLLYMEVKNLLCTHLK